MKVVELYIICRTCKVISYVGLGDLDEDLELHIYKGDVDVDRILRFLAKHHYHDVSLITKYQRDADGLILWKEASEE